MYCSKCGQFNEEKNQFCKNCGNPINSVNNNPVNMPNQSPNEPNLTNNIYPVNYSTVETKKPYWMIIVVNFLLFFIISMLKFIFQMLGIEVNDTFMQSLTVLQTLPAFTFIPSIILVVILYNKKTDRNMMQQVENMNNILSNRNISQDEKLLIAYIGPNYQKIMNQKFSLPAFFLAWGYIFYRKMYILGAMECILIILWSYIPIPSFIINLILMVLNGFCFNKLYMIQAKKFIQKVKMNSTSYNENNWISICSQKGGTSIGMAIGLFIVFIFISGFISHKDTKKLTCNYYEEDSGMIFHGEIVIRYVDNKAKDYNLEFQYNLGDNKEYMDLAYSSVENEMKENIDEVNKNGGKASISSNDNTITVKVSDKLNSITDIISVDSSDSTYEAVKKEIEKGMGTQFDPEIAQIMVKMIYEDVNYSLCQKTEFKKNILVVDDEEINVDFIKFALKDEPQYIIYSVGNGHEALEIIQNVSIDIILLDIQMPDMDGFEVYRRLREKTDAPIVFMSVNKEYEAIQRATELGCDDYIVKPFLPKVLVEILHSVVQNIEAP